MVCLGRWEYDSLLLVSNFLGGKEFVYINTKVHTPFVNVKHFIHGFSISKQNFHLFQLQHKDLLGVLRLKEITIVF